MGWSIHSLNYPMALFVPYSIILVCTSCLVDLQAVYVLRTMTTFVSVLVDHAVSDLHSK